MIWVVAAIIFIGIIIVSAINDIPRRQLEEQEIRAREYEKQQEADSFHDWVESHAEMMRNEAIKKHGKLTAQDREEIEQFRQRQVEEEKSIRKYGRTPGL